MNDQDRFVPEPFVQVLTGGVPLLGERGVVVAEPDDPLGTPAGVAFGEGPQLVAQRLDVGDVAVGCSQQTGDAGLYADPGQVPVGVDEARQQSLS